jgi:hypothetical protein
MPIGSAAERQWPLRLAPLVPLTIGLISESNYSNKAHSLRRSRKQSRCRVLLFPGFLCLETSGQHL